MPTPFSSILRGVNRDPAEPLHILCMDTHEAWQTTLAKTGHRFFSLQHPQMKRWDCRFRPYPGNYQPLRGDDPCQQIRPDMAFDLILSQSKFGQFQLLSQVAHSLNCPLISMEHTLPAPHWPEATITQHCRMRGKINVFVSDYSVKAWGVVPDSSVRIIPHGVDTGFFDSWIGGNGRILTVVNQYPQRDLWCGWTLYRQVTDALPVEPWGDSPGFSRPAENEQHLRDIYRRSSVFLNTSQISSCPVSLLEAMAVGYPVVTTATCMLPEIIKDGVNGFISNEPAVLRQRLQLLLAHPEMGRGLGEAARHTVRERFGEKQFIALWNRIFQEAIER
jgi:hypothetical protein